MDKGKTKDPKEEAGKDAVVAGTTGDDDDYDPHLHRNMPAPTSNLETLVHLLKGSLGTGILAMPEAYMYAGLWNATVSTILIGILLTYCLHMLVKAQYILCKRLKRPMLLYPESMKAALLVGPKGLRPFANSSPYVVNVFLLIYQLGICCVYIVFVGVNIKAVVDQHISKPIWIVYYILMLFVPFLLLLYVKNLKWLVPFSFFSNVITLIATGIVMYFLCRDLGPMKDIPSPVFGESLWGYALYFGTTLFSLEAVGVIIAVENNMKTPKGFGGWFGVLNISMFSVTLLYIIVGFFGYWRYGNETEPSVTLNFPNDDWLSKTVKIVFSVAIYISYGLQGYVPIKILWDEYMYKPLKEKGNLCLWEYLMRTLVVIVTFILAATIPFLGLFISFFGAFGLAALGIVFPAIMEICVKWDGQLGRCKWVLVRNIFICLIGLVGLLAGSAAAIAGIVNEFQNKGYAPD